MEPESPILDAEDILFDSLQTLYDYHPITLNSTQGSPITYTSTSACSKSSNSDPISITLRTPDTQASNWFLHANSIWVSSIYLADHITDLNLDLYTDGFKSNSREEEKVRVLELGASAGLPSILIAKLFPDVLVTVTDYPDDELIKTLKGNIEDNNVAGCCKVLPYAWGSDPTVVLGNSKGFDVVIAADTLWNPELHTIFVDTLKSTLQKSSSSRIHLVVGLHTGRYTIQAFLTHIQQNSGLHVESISEREVTGSSTRIWDVLRSEEDEAERRRWIIWMTLAWEKSMIE
jgi:nicotinamide N-methyltransferase